MSRLRISVVKYLNTTPLVYGFTNGPLRGKYELSFTVPSLCAEALRTGDADVAIIPAIEYQRMDGVVILPDIAIASKNQVRSLLVIAKRPIEQTHRFALDRSSRSTQALVRILCVERWKISPEFVESPPDVTAMLADADAALVIGDTALRLATGIENVAKRQTDGHLAFPPKVAGVSLMGCEQLHAYDVVEQWRQMTGLPAVLAFWAARPDSATPEVIADFLASREYGLERIAEISATAARELQLPAAALESYLSRNVDYSLDENNRRGLDLFYRLSAKLGLIPQTKPLEWAAVATGARASVR